MPEIASSQSSRNDSKWDCEKKLREMGMDPLTNKEEGICFAKVPSYSSFNVRIALGKERDYFFYKTSEQIHYYRNLI